MLRSYLVGCNSQAHLCLARPRVTLNVAEGLLRHPVETQRNRFRERRSFVVLFEGDLNAFTLGKMAAFGFERRGQSEIFENGWVQTICHPVNIV